MPLHVLSTEDFLQRPTWNNVYFQSNGKPLFFYNWVNSNILYVKDLYNEFGNFRSIDDFAVMLRNKTNYLCEYMILKKIFNPLSKKFECRKGQYVNIRHKELFLFSIGLENVRVMKSNLYYEIFVKQNFHKPNYQSTLSRTFNITDKSVWKTIYQNKIQKIKDSAIAEFNYNVLNNLICNNYIVSKWKNDVTMYCSICKNVIENTEHMIFNCKNVRRIWEIVGITLKFEIKWKQIVLGFYYADNDYIDFLNFIISFVACRIYKYKMFCRIESLEENEFNVYCNVKENIKKLYLTLTKIQHKYNMKIINNLIKNLC